MINSNYCRVIVELAVHVLVNNYMVCNDSVRFLVEYYVYIFVNNCMIHRCSNRVLVNDRIHSHSDMVLVEHSAWSF